jgi:hypothetical protein
MRKRNCIPSFDTCEGRLLLSRIASLNVPPHPPVERSAPVASPPSTLQVAAKAPQLVTTKSIVIRVPVVTLENKTPNVVNYQFRWSNTGSWKNYSLKPGSARWHYLTGAATSSTKPQIRFDYSFSSGFQAKTYSLQYRYGLYGEGLTGPIRPVKSDGKLYRFLPITNGLDLYSVV